MKYFIDCGTYFFQGLNEFERMYSFDNSWKVYSFEANPTIYKETFGKQKNKSYELVHQNKAVWIEDGEIEISVEGKDKRGCSSTVLENPPKYDKAWGSIHMWNNKQKVPCFDLDAFIKDISKNSEKIIVKIDVEGAEFAILDKIIKNETHKLIDDLYVEFHERFFMDEEPKYAEKKKELVKILTSECKNTFKDWK